MAASNSEGGLDHDGGSCSVPMASKSCLIRMHYLQMSEVKGGYLGAAGGGLFDEGSPTAVSDSE
ncbi:hypothetical protein ACHAWF_015428, partial [Thalassiosira exigua]